MRLLLLTKGLIALNDPVARFYETDRPITIKHLLTHTMGIGHKALNVEGNSYENICEKILAMPSDIPLGSDVLYSCPGFILLGKILERIFGKRLDECFLEFVAKPLGMTETTFLPRNSQNVVNSNLEAEKKGVVNDYNCQFLGGVAGNAGLFSNICDVTKYVGFLLSKGRPLISEKTFEMAVQNYTASMSASRGLGFLYIDERYRQTGTLFANGAIGHCGHTGQSVFVEYRTGLYTIILSDATISTVRKYGKEHYGEVMEMRERLHVAIRSDFDITY